MIARLLPPKVRQAVYVVFATAFALEAIWDIVPSGLETKIMQTLAALGFVLAAGNVDRDA